VCSAVLPSRISFLLRFGPAHASPNSGWPEAALAAILDCRFGGTHDYFGQAVEKPYIGTNPRPLTTADCRLSIRIALIAETIAVILTISLIGLISHIGHKNYEDNKRINPTQYMVIGAIFECSQ
jgi:adenosylcobinamide-phosphate synthase